MTTSSAPYLKLAWTATALGTGFGGYNIYRRPSRSVSQPWTQIAAITVPAGYTAATVETQHNAFNDYEAGWQLAGGQWADGFDYAVTAVSAVTLLESLVTAGPSMVQQTRTNNPWVVCNAAPFLNFPIASLQQLTSADEPARTSWRVAGRDTAVARTRLELPPRTWTVASRVFSRVGEDPARTWRAAAASGLTFAVHDPLGDRLVGVLEAPSSLPHEPEGTWTLTGQVVETSKDSSLVADYNLPAGLVFTAASSQNVTIADAAGLTNPGASPFTIAYFGTFGDSGTANVYFEKGTAVPATNPGWALMNAAVANQVQFVVRGATTVATTAFTQAGLFDGKRHSIVGTSDGVTQQLFTDSVLRNNNVVGTGAVTTATGIAVASDPGSVNFMDCTGQAWGYWPRILTQTEVTALHQYLAGVPGTRPPGGATLFMDLRDARVWDGRQAVATLNDLSGNGLNGTINNAPKTNGIPWNIAQIDRF